MTILEAKTEEGALLASALLERAKQRMKEGYITNWRNSLGVDIHGDFGGGEAFCGPWGICIKFMDLSDRELEDIGWTEPFLFSSNI